MRQVVVSRFEKHYQLLIADDDPRFREVLCAILEPFFELIEAESGEQAIDIVEHCQIDIALFDMHMHVLTGLETLKVVKTINQIMPVIIITADATDDLKRDATEADAFDVLSKPVSKSDLVSTVSTAIANTYDANDGWLPMN